MTTTNELIEWLNVESILAKEDNSPIAASRLRDSAQRLRELETQFADLHALQTSLAINQPIWPNNWSQPVAMIAYEFHLKQTQLADAQKDAARYQWLRSRTAGGDYRVAGIIYSEGGKVVDAGIDAAMQPKE